jgi:hypothetical protein
MEVKRVPLASGSQGVDPSGQSGPEDRAHPDKQKKKKKGSEESTTAAPASASEKAPAEWEESDLSRQPVDSETVVDLLSHAPQAQSKKPVYATGTKATPTPKLNRKY